MLSLFTFAIGLILGAVLAYMHVHQRVLAELHPDSTRSARRRRTQRGPGAVEPWRVSMDDVAGLEAEVRRSRGERAGALYTQEALEAARAALRPNYGIVVRVRG